MKKVLALMFASFLLAGCSDKPVDIYYLMEHTWEGNISEFVDIEGDQELPLLAEVNFDRSTFDYEIDLADAYALFLTLPENSDLDDTTLTRIMKESALADQIKGTLHYRIDEGTKLVVSPSVGDLFAMKFDLKKTKDGIQVTWEKPNAEEPVTTEFTIK